MFFCRIIVCSFLILDFFIFFVYNAAILTCFAGYRKGGGTLEYYDAIVIGGGAAGLMAAGAAGLSGKRVLLLERNPQNGRKLLITGKGRCNVTNACTMQEFIETVGENGKFLYRALSVLSPQDTVTLFQSLGVPLKTERGARVFPVSDQAGDVLHALERFAFSGEVVRKQAKVTDLLLTDGVLSGVHCEEGISFSSPKVIVATGGLSYPKTGSTGDGYRLARQAGHTVISPRAALCPIETVSDDHAALQGLSLKNVTLILRNPDGKTLFSELGEMLFTHFGISGPLVLSASSYIRQPDAGGYTVLIDLKPGLSFEKLDSRLLRDFEENHNKVFANSLSALLPRKLIPVVVKKSGIPAGQRVNQIAKEQRLSLCRLLKEYTVSLRRLRPIDEAIITAGGISLKEIDPKTMQSKLVPGLYFAGEVLDLDAPTGGFNLQIAFSTGYLAGIS